MTKAATKNVRTVVITGGSTGIGFEIAKLLNENDSYELVLISKEKAKLDHALTLLPSKKRVSAFACDVGDPKQVEVTCKKILAIHDSVYGLINNAAIYPFGGLENTTLDSWDLTMNVNLKAPFLFSQLLLPAMSKNGGRIINISSTAAMIPNHFALAYSVSKAALNQLTKTLAKEIGNKKITVNCICPGIVKTGMHEEYHKSKTDLNEFYARRGSQYPMGRVGEPHDVAVAVKFLLSDEAGWITGDVMVVDGGRALQ